MLCHRMRRTLRIDAHRADGTNRTRRERGACRRDVFHQSSYPLNPLNPFYPYFRSVDV